MPVSDPVSLLVSQAAATLRRSLGSRQPSIGLVLGSGLGFLADGMEAPVRVSYGEIPGCHLPTVPGHKGEVVLGRFAGREAIMLSGRFHMYEGHTAAESAHLVRVLGTLGVRTLLLTNAAGGIRRTFPAGTLMLIADHLNLTFRNPLIGPQFEGEERFPDMSDPYDPELRRLARDVARRSGVHLEEGVYAGLLGPSYETPAEVRMLERFGADAVGMSTVIEVIAARARGMRCLGISTITNPAAGLSPVKLSHEEVMEAARKVAGELGRLVEGIVAGLDD